MSKFFFSAAKTEFDEKEINQNLTKSEGNNSEQQNTAEIEHQSSQNEANVEEEEQKNESMDASTTVTATVSQPVIEENTVPRSKPKEELVPIGPPAWEQVL